MMHSTYLSVTKYTDKLTSLTRMICSSCKCKDKYLLHASVTVTKSYLEQDQY